MLVIICLLLVVTPQVLSATHLNSAREIFKSAGDLNFAFVLQNCRNNSTRSPFVVQSLINSAIWTVERLNFLEFVAPLTFGLAIDEICTQKENYKAIFRLFELHDEQFFVGSITDFTPSERLKSFSEVLNLRTRELVKYPQTLIKASVEVLIALNLKDNLTILAPNRFVINEFFSRSRNRWLCIQNYHIYEKNPANLVKNLTGNVVIFGDYFRLNSILQFVDELQDDLKIIFIPLDGSVLTELPPNCYILVPSYPVLTPDYQQKAHFLPSPLLFEVASPILNYAQNILNFILENCNDTIYKLNCLRHKFRDFNDIWLDPAQILDVLKIESLKSSFVYNVVKSENSTLAYTKLFSYNIFNHNLTILDSNFEPANISEPICQNQNHCLKQCKNFHYENGVNSFIVSDDGIRIRSESWVFAFLSISLLGVLFCVVILIFFLVCICRRDILDGNPVLTLLLLLAVMLMYTSVLPLTLEGTKGSVKEAICLARSLAITLSYASAFSLILSRSILLATASKEIGFMSHIAGPVQSFLCLFIFGVQAALSLQIIGRCNDIFRGVSFIYLLSYNVMLLLLLLCICPLIVKCQRNYQEGKYFTIAVSIIAGVWCVWIPSYALLNEAWRDLILSFGLVGTASVLIGAIFVPRTYLMMIAAARDKITSTLPSLATATSAIDIYRTGAQPVYDCVNVAAVNAMSVARGGVAQIQQPDLYTCPNLPDDIDYDDRSDSPVNSDKVTRF